MLHIGSSLDECLLDDLELTPRQYLLLSQEWASFLSLCQDHVFLCLFGVLGDKPELLAW